MRLTIALIGALIVVNDANNNTNAAAAAPIYRLNLSSDRHRSLLYILSAHARILVIIMSNYRRCHRHFQKLMPITARPDPAVGIAFLSYTRLRPAASSTKYAKIDKILDKFQNVSSSRARVEAEQMRGRKYLVAQLTTR